MAEIITKSPHETELLGQKIGAAIHGKNVFLALYGDLGAGKTAFVRGLASILSPGSRVKSPTYTIVNEYRRGDYPLFHFDFYRISSEEELDAMGFDEYLTSGICVGEWSENLGSRLPSDALIIRIEKLGESERKITIDGMTNDFDGEVRI